MTPPSGMITKYSNASVRSNALRTCTCGATISRPVDETDRAPAGPGGPFSGGRRAPGRGRSSLHRGTPASREDSANGCGQVPAADPFRVTFRILVSRTRPALLRWKSAPGRIRPRPSPTARSCAQRRSSDARPGTSCSAYLYMSPSWDGPVGTSRNSTTYLKLSMSLLCQKFLNEISAPDHSGFPIFSAWTTPRLRCLSCPPTGVRRSYSALRHEAL